MKRESLARVSDVLRDPQQRILGETPLQSMVADAMLHPERIPPPPAPIIERRVPTPYIPKRFAGVTFDQFDPGRQKGAVDRKSCDIALRAARLFVQRYHEQKPVMLALIGGEGLGKSHLLYAAAQTLIARGEKVYARPWHLLADELRYGGDHPYSPALPPIEAYEARRLMWTSARAVFLDEIGRTSATEFDPTELHKFSAWAYDEHLSVMLTSNVEPLSDVMGPFAASRYTQLILTGDDQRQP